MAMDTSAIGWLVLLSRTATVTSLYVTHPHKQMTSRMMDSWIGFIMEHLWLDSKPDLWLVLLAACHCIRAKLREACAAD